MSYVYRYGRNQFLLNPQIVGNELKALEARLGHAPTAEEMFTASKEEISIFHWVHQKETMVLLQMEWLRRLRVLRLASAWA
jgi:hypothetical protein